MWRVNVGGIGGWVWAGVFLIFLGVFAFLGLFFFSGCAIMCGVFSSVGYQSGQLGRTVNPLALPSYVRIVDPPPFFAHEFLVGFFVVRLGMGYGAVVSASS